ncbi:MAG: hypothetical protein E7586_05110 [Ruminococcaceae bacterium]|nr:hypothetical protein [Oscillospiraceae bacterium]
MDSDFASKLQSVLSNPEAMSKITAIASSLGNGNSGETQKEVQPELPRETETHQAFTPVNQTALPQGDHRIALLNSIKPLLREEKRGRVDSLLNALTVASMLKAFKK